MDLDTQEQLEKQPADHLKPWQFKPGQSGNPGGRTKGKKSLKTFIREYLESLSDEEKIEYMKGMDKIDLFKMAEGNPTNDDTVKVILPQIEIAEDIARKYALTPKPETNSKE